MNTPPVITIDGPSGSGKGTLCRLIARELQWQLLDSGAIYRLLALAVQQRHISPQDTAQLVQLADQYNIHFTVDQALTVHSFLDGINVSDAIRTPEISQLTSKISSIAEVRQALLEKQRQFRQFPGLVTDGRDMGTVVFPDANLKIFLDASAQQRAQRRYKQLKNKGITVTLATILAELKERDARDSQRDVAPLTPAADSMVIDSSIMSIDQVFHTTLQWIRERKLVN